MTFTLACERAADLRAVAPVAGSRWSNSACSGPIAALGIHGNPDEQVDYESGLEAMARILGENGCDTSQSTAIENGCIEYSCNAGTPGIWCEHAEGHNWPAFAAQAVKDFFDSF
jgi:polyhydroxybutyrate depolymerase